MKLQKSVNNIVNEICNKKQIKKSHGDYMVESFFKNMKSQIQSNQMPTIMLHKFGEFTPSLYKVKKRLSFLEKKQKESGLNESYSKRLRTEIKKLREIRNRLNKEKTKRSN